MPFTASSATTLPRFGRLPPPRLTRTGDALSQPGNWRLSLGSLATRRSASWLPSKPAKTESNPKDLLGWTERVRVINGERLIPSDLPWLRDLYAFDGPELWVMKASQVFISEWMLTTALWVCDVGWGGRGNALYVFPTQAQGDDFAQARIDGAIEASPYLAGRVGALTEVRGKSAVSRVCLKRIGDGHLYIRGADRRRQLISIDGDALLLDEVDEYKAGVVDVARKRLNSAKRPLIRCGSTPKYPASGISPVWQATTRSRYHLTCSCGHRQHLVFPENLTRDGRLVCAKCGSGLDNTSEGEWVAEEPAASVAGFHVNRLYSPRADLVALATLGYRIRDGLVTDPTAIQEFHNQDLGLPHAPAGGSVTDDVLVACEREYAHAGPVQKRPVAMGVDVGSVLHVYLKSAVPEGDDPRRSRLVLATTVPDFEELAKLFVRFQVNFCVIDQGYQGEKVSAFKARFPGRVFGAFYPNVSQWRHQESAVWNTDEAIVQAHRTRLLDATFDRFYQQLEELPRDARYVPGLYEQLKAPVKITREDSAGRTVAVYDEGAADDHYSHAAAYANLAWDVVTQPPMRPKAIKVGG